MFDLALQRELNEVMVDAKRRAEQIRQPSDLWKLEKYLTNRRREIDRKFDYQSSVLVTVFGNLIRSGKLTERELRDLSEDELIGIRRFAALCILRVESELSPFAAEY